jgi:predicted tellurium resistance membrane protein TerC
MGFHIPKGYLYFAMLFSVLVEGLNVTLARRRKRARQAVETAAHSQRGHEAHVS